MAEIIKSLQPIETRLFINGEVCALNLLTSADTTSDFESLRLTYHMHKVPRSLKR